MYQRCLRCVMDNTSDLTISFDDHGHCNYCAEAIQKKELSYFPGKAGENILNLLLEELRQNGIGKKYDCIMGISGGLDSSYLLYLGHKWGLRILGIHIDDGYDTEIASKNIASLINATSFKYIVVKPDSDQFNDLLRAHFLAGVPNLAVPQDNILLSYLHKYACEYGIQYFLSGGNYALESILQRGNTYTAFDKKNIIDIHTKFGMHSIDKLPIMSEYLKAWHQLSHKVKTIRPLNYLNYNKEEAMKELSAFCGFEYFGRKHHENSFTRVLQDYYFYNKFNVDKRTSHLSSLIISGQMTRNQALTILEEPIYTEEDIRSDLTKVLEGFSMTREEFDRIIKLPPKQHTDYKTSHYALLKDIFQKLRRQ